MKIIQVIPMFGLAGAETMCENLTLALINQGHDVKVVSLYDYHSAITDRLEKNNKVTGYQLRHPTPQRNLTNSKEKSKILITMQKHAYYRFFQKEIIIKIV